MSRRGAPPSTGATPHPLPTTPASRGGDKSKWEPFLSAKGISGEDDLCARATHHWAARASQREATALTWGTGRVRDARPLSPRTAALTCVPDRLPRAFVHALQLGHTALQGLHAAPHAAGLLPALPERAHLLVELPQLLGLAVYHSLPSQRRQKATRLELREGAAPPLPKARPW